jgi:hypothetical protein
VSISVVGRDEKNELARGGRFTPRDEMTCEVIARRESLFRGVAGGDQDTLEADTGLAELAMMSEDALREGARGFVRLLEEDDEVAGTGSEASG